MSFSLPAPLPMPQGSVMGVSPAPRVTPGGGGIPFGASFGEDPYQGDDFDNTNPLMVHKDAILRLGPNPAAAADHINRRGLTFQRVQRASRVPMIDAVEMKSLSSINMMLKSHHGRAEYGNDWTCEKLLNDWVLAGIQITNPTSRHFTSSTSVLSTCAVEAEVTDVANIWRETGHAVRKGDYLYLLCVRRKYQPGVMDSLAYAQQKRLSKFARGPDEYTLRHVHAMEIAALDEAQFQKRRRLQDGRLAVALGAISREEPGLAVDEKAPYMWQFVPHVSHNHEGPSPLLYQHVDPNNIKESWTGAAILVGRVVDVPEPNDDRSYVINARNVVNPAIGGAAVRREMDALPKVHTYLYLHPVG